MELTSRVQGLENRSCCSFPSNDLTSDEEGNRQAINGLSGKVEVGQEMMVREAMPVTG